jgi:hypothetical protein
LAAPDSPYEHILKAWTHMNLGDDEAAAAEARCYINLADWQGRNAPYAAVLAHLALRRAGRHDEAEAILREATENADPSGWAAQIIKTLRGELREDVMLSQAQDNTELTAARAYLGLRHAVDGRATPAREHLEWVRAHGDRRFVGYGFALGRLDQLKALGD